MALRREDTSSGCSWTPKTPAKLGSKEHQLICVNSEENRSVQAKWLESERLISVNQVTQINLTDSRRTLGDFLAESPYQNIPACCSSNSANVSEGSQVYGEALCNFDIWRSEKTGSSRVYGEGLRVNDKFSMNDPDQWVNMSFTDLLALADGGSNIMSFGNSLTPNAGNLPEGKFDGGNSMPETPFGGTSIPSRPSFDHNTLPRAALSNSTPSHFEPITPEKNWQMEQRQDSTAMQDLSTYDGPTKEAQNNTVTREEVEGHNEKKKQSQLANGQLCENYKPDKEGTEEVDLTKTPQQKSRRKKHRPKVIKEGKTKSTPKPRPEKPLGTQESRVKRKYTRRVSVINSISSPSQGEAIETDTNRKAAMSKDTPVGKRQRTSRKAVDKAEATMDMGAIKTVDQMTGRSTRSSCRRSLNFDSVCQVRDECWMYIPSSNCNIESQAESFSRDDQSRTNVEHRQGKEVIMEKNDMGIAHRITGSIYQELDDYLSRYEKCSPSSAPAEADQPKKDYCPSDRIVSIKGKCQIVFSDVTNDKEVNNIQLIANISNDSISSSLLTPDRLAGGLKRHMDTIAKAEQYSNDSTKTLNNPIPRFSQRTSKNCGIPEMHFPVVYKRNGNEMGFNTTTNLQYSNVKVGRGTDSIAQLLPSATNQGSSDLQCEATDTLIGNTNGTKDGRQVFEDLLALGPREKIRKRKSKAPTQVQNSISIQEMRVSQGEYTKKSKNGKKIGQHAHMKALVADTSSPVTKGHLKRILPNSILGNGYNHHELPARSTGSPLAITWKQTSQIDSIVDQLNQLNLHAETSQVSTQNRHAFVAHHMHFQLQGAIVPYQTGGAVVAFDRSFDQVRRRQPRPKVDLDDETTRVWKLLLENINSEGIDGTDEKNAKWWEEERRVFNGRADSFIARMHLVQGDRRFSPWKGSVVDSVVGVFLTQNVSDHLSSSAFMALAARFPLKAKTIPAELHEARVGTKMDEPEICMLEPEETVGSNKNGVDNVKLLHYTENGDIRVVNSVKSLGNSFADSIAKEGLRDISECSSVISHASVSNKSPSLNGDGQDMDEAVSSQTTVISSQNSADSLIAQTARTESSQQSHTGEDPATGAQPNRFTSSTSFVKLLQMAGTVRHGVYGYCSDKEEFDRNQNVQSESSPMSSQTEYSLTGSTFAVEANVCSMSASRLTPNSGTGEVQVELSKRCSECSDSYRGKGLPTAEISELSVEYVSHTTMKFTSVTSEECPNFSRPNDKIGINPEIAGKQMSEVPSLGHFEGNCCKIDIPDIAYPQNLMDVTGSNNNSDISRKSEHIEVNSKKGPVYHPGEMVNGPKTKGEKKGKDKQDPVDWDVLRKQALKSGSKGERTANTMDSVDWEAVRRADVSEVADAIKERGMNNKLAERIKDFLDRIVRDHESIDLEWLRDVPPDKAKEYLLSVRGLGLKSVECVRLLTLHQLAFPVDTNVGRIAVRLGWVPLRPLPESLQLHLLELYPVLESIQKYLWPRLCKLDQKTLYELHYQLITFGKVFCTKSRPNCNACPMRGECRHFASAFASARLALPMPENKSIVSAAENISAGPYPTRAVNTLGLPALLANHMDVTPGVNNYVPIIEEPKTPEPIIELPATPEIEDTQIPECDIEDTFYEDPDEIPSIQLNMEEFTQNLQKVMQQNTELQEGSMSNALVALTREAASIPVPKLKNVSRLRTEHQVYELPDSHPLLQGMEQREPDDPSPYLLAIWTPGETINSIEPPERRCSLQESEKLCTDETCSSCNSKREINSQTVRGTLLIPCRTAMRGSFPLNGTYFQVNEVFSDHESSLTPIDVPREWLWNLRRRTVYFGTSVPTIFKGLITEQIQYCFWRGFVCVRGFDRKARAPRPLIARLHFPASKLAKAKGKTGEN